MTDAPWPPYAWRFVRDRSLSGPLPASFIADLSIGLLDGERMLFSDAEPWPVRSFYLRRKGSAFLIEDWLCRHLGTFADVAAAIADGWREVDRAAERELAGIQAILDGAPIP